MEPPAGGRMLLKQADDRSADIAALRTLLGRRGLSNRQRSDIQKQIDNIVTGYRGEENAAYFLNETFGDAENTALIHDLRIEHEGRTAQIDHLLLTRFRWAYVVETKSLNADLTCNEAGEWTAWYGKRRVPIASPIEQARRHVDVLNAWLTAHDAGVRRIEAVLIVSPTSHVGGDRAHGDEIVPVIRADLFKRWWERQRVTIPTLNILWAVATAWSTAEFEALAKSLTEAHRPSTRNWAARFGVTVDASPSISEPGSHSSGEPPAFRPLTATRSATSSAHVATTSLGPVTIRKVGDGRFALRHAACPQLESQIAALVADFAQWQPRFKNWLISPQDVERVTALLASV